MKIKSFLIATGLINLLVLTGVSGLFGQGNVINLSLKECIKIAVEKNTNVKTAQIEKQKTEGIISETYSALYPKISIGGSFQDNLKMAVMLLPGEIFQQPGTFIPVSFGTKYSANAAANLNMILYNQTALTALKLSKKVLELNDLGIEKVKDALAFEISKLYFMTLTTEQQKNILEENIKRTNQLKDITKVLVDNGMALQLDYDRVNISIENLLTQLSNVEAGLEQQLNTLKYILNIPMRDSILLTDDAEQILIQSTPNMTTDFSEHIDIRLLESQKELNRLNKKIVNAGYFPTLLFTGQYAFQGMRNEFKNYFKDSPESHWYQSANIGLSISIPIFDGFEKRSKANQVELEYQQTEIQIADKKENFNVDYSAAINNYNNNKTNLERQTQNIQLATNVYNETALKYREGMASMSNLLQDEMSLSAAQANYLSALYNFKEAELKIMSLNGDILKLIKD